MTEYEQLTIKVPKQVMNLLRQVQPLNQESPEQWIEYAVVDTLRAVIEGKNLLPEPTDLIEKYNLGPVFKEICGE